MKQLKTRMDLAVVGEKSDTFNKYLSELNKLEVSNSDIETELGRRIQNGDESAITELINLNLRFVVNVAKQHQWSKLPLMDLINEGNIGLIIAAKKWDPTRGFKFISYAVWHIRQKILQFIKDHDKLIRLPINRGDFLIRVKIASAYLETQLERPPTNEEIADKLEVSLDEVRIAMLNNTTESSLSYNITDEFKLIDVIENTESASPAEVCENASSTNLLINILKQLLSQRDYYILSLRYGLEGNIVHDLKEIGEEVDLSRERVRQIINISLRRIRWRCPDLIKLLS